MLKSINRRRVNNSPAPAKPHQRNRRLGTEHVAHQIDIQNFVPASPTRHIDRFVRSNAGIVTRDPGLVRVCRSVEKVAPSDSTVILLGESGTGKEILAKTLHQASARQGKRFMAINCAAIPETLLESE